MRRSYWRAESENEKAEVIEYSWKMISK